MARKPFNLRSGNKTSFKMMGSSPVKVAKTKHHVEADYNSQDHGPTSSSDSPMAVRPAKSEDPSKHEAYAAREQSGPMDLKGSPAKIIKKQIKKKIKDKVDDKVKDVVKNKVDDVLENVSPDDLKTTTGGQFHKGSRGYKQVQENMQTILRNNPGAKAKSLSWWKKGLKNTLLAVGAWEVGSGAYNVVYNIGEDFGWRGEDKTKESTDTDDSKTSEKKKPDHLKGGGDIELDTSKTIDEKDLIEVE